MGSNSKALDRVQWVDLVRGIAIVLMVIFHFCYDLRYFGYVDWDVPNGPNWWPFRYLILTLFIGTVGMSLSLAHARGIRWRSFLKRLAQIALAAIAITIGSLYLFPNGWIYFGILHFIAVGSVLSLAIVRWPRVALVLGSLIVIGYATDTLSGFWPFMHIREWLPEYTEDYVPLFPWLGVIFLGVAAAGLLPLNRLLFPSIPLADHLAKLGRHGLVIYLIHQPILFAGFFAVGAIF